MKILLRLPAGRERRRPAEAVSLFRTISWAALEGRFFFTSSKIDNPIPLVGCAQLYQVISLYILSH